MNNWQQVKKLLWLVFSLVPAAFIFHYYEYGQYSRREEASFLLVGSILNIIILGLLATEIKIKSIILINLLATGISIILAMLFIPDTGWFKPVGRTGSVLFVAVLLSTGQLLVRTVTQAIVGKGHAKPVKKVN